MKKVVLGLSGGVDSAVAAALLKKEYDVTGLYLDIGAETGEDDARAVAEALGIAFRVRDIRRELEEKVCVPFAASYLRGETPNPCIMCNPSVKFAALLDEAEVLAADYIATGHYARVKNGRVYKGQPSNDQSYMLCRLTQAQRELLLLPLGDFEKSEVRALAQKLGLAVAQKPDSMEICFIPDDDYAAFIEARGDFPPEGNFVDEMGKILGRHRGIHRYTLGQRRGLGISAERRIFVSAIRPDTNEIVLSDGAGLFVNSLRAGNLVMHCDTPRQFRCAVKVRHSKAEHPATVTLCGDSAAVCFDAPVRAPTAGQSAVFYDGDCVIGTGLIIS